MSKAEKLAAKILGGKSDQKLLLCRSLPRNRTRRLPPAFGKRKPPNLLQRWVVEIINVQPRRGGQAKPYQVKQVRELLLKYKIDIE